MKVIFDTSFWSYLAESDQEGAFVDLEKKLNLEVILPPSILLEVQKTKDKEKRIKIIKVMNKGYRKKERTEVDMESEELIYEVRRLHPECSKYFSSTKRINKLRKFWTKDIWKNSIEKTDFYHNRMVRSEKRGIGIVINEQESIKKGMQEAKWDVNKTRPSDMKAKFSEKSTFALKYVDVNKDYDPWRIINLYYYKKSLENVSLQINHDDRTVADWCEPWIDIKEFMANEKRYFDFWLEEVEIRNMQRNWLRWAVSTMQPLRKIANSNPYDEQHSAYLINVDMFYTCDRRYYECLKVIYDDNQVTIAKPVLIDADINNALCQIEKNCNNAH